uniref:Uncharacterized protein n=1 Tax=Cebus imitator TaxID=2715852 RepID=A0A2K5RC40_CEBIM
SQRADGLVLSKSPTSKSPNIIYFHRPLHSVIIQYDIHSLSLLGCKLGFWTDLEKNPFSLGPLRSQLNQLHSGS